MLEIMPDRRLRNIWPGTPVAIHRSQQSLSTKREEPEVRNAARTARRDAVTPIRGPFVREAKKQRRRPVVLRLALCEWRQPGFLWLSGVSSCERRPMRCRVEAWKGGRSFESLSLHTLTHALLLWLITSRPPLPLQAHRTPPPPPPPVPVRPSFQPQRTGLSIARSDSRNTPGRTGHFPPLHPSE